MSTYTRSLSLRAKILGAVGAVIAASALAGAFTLYRLNTTTKALTEVSHQQALALEAAQLRSAFQVQHQKLKDVLLRGADPAKLAQYTSDFKSAAADVAKRYAHLKPQLEATNDVYALKLLHHFSVHDTFYNSSFAKALKAVHTAHGFDGHAGDDIMNGLDKPEQNALKDVAYLLSHDVGAKTAAANASKRTTMWMSIAALVFAALLGIGIALLLSRGIRRAVAPILDRLQSLRDNCVADLRAGLQALADGDLTKSLTPVTEPIANPSGDELGQVSRSVNEIIADTVGSLEAFNEATAGLRAIVGTVADSSSKLNTASQQMASTSEEAGRAAAEIAGAVGEVATGAERQVRMVVAARESTQETAEAAETARQLSAEGVAAAEEADQAMRAVRESTDAVTDAIRQLGAKSEQIGGIVETITGIAGQTNLLALNAAIEAARAGEQGRGFAVVAEEVRKLAEESQQAAATIAKLIGEIQDETQNAVAVVETGAERTEAGAVVVERTRAAFTRIGDSVQAMTGRFAEIAEAMSEVSAVAEQSSAGAEQVSASTEETTASTQEIAASAQELASTAAELETLVSRFRLAA